ncbi:AtpZ/AtpI family protein [uncultured Amphritea sp.]|uniref:AtpZ/AtpI family protein n=1 Tax=uncultured Amphritea sp. TaxID=981605 RepID=UPI00263A1971|nr:AtpZ/AtpI family protein [uncultured Amphritea sp.]
MRDKPEVENKPEAENKPEVESMAEAENKPCGSGNTEFSQQVGSRAERKLKAQRHVNKTVWSGLGMMGLIGWSVAIPTLLGAALGVWLDKEYPGGRSWTLMLLVVGLCLGCFNAWRWVDKEDREIHRHEEGDDLD